MNICIVYNRLYWLDVNISSEYRWWFHHRRFPCRHFIVEIISILFRHSENVRRSIYFAICMVDDRTLRRLDQASSTSLLLPAEEKQRRRYSSLSSKGALAIDRSKSNAWQFAYNIIEKAQTNEKLQKNSDQCWIQWLVRWPVSNSDGRGRVNAKSEMHGCQQLIRDEGFAQSLMPASPYGRNIWLMQS